MEVTDFEGDVLKVICPDLDATSGVCRLRQRALAGGRLSQLLERAAEDSLDTRGIRCELACH